MRLTVPQQLIGDGIVAWLIVQRLEAKVSSGALPHKSAGIYTLGIQEKNCQ
jgi:hypothetical protein